jgi:hypothetical protein
MLPQKRRTALRLQALRAIHRALDGLDLRQADGGKKHRHERHFIAVRVLRRGLAYEDLWGTQPILGASNRLHRSP